MTPEEIATLIANLRKVPGGVYARGHSHDERLPVGLWCRQAAEALERLSQGGAA